MGLGAAKDVVLEWSCDIDKFSNVISKYDPNQESKITQRNGKVGNVLLLNNKNDRLPGKAHVIQNQLKSEVTHIIPVQVEPKPYKLTVPLFYLDLYLYYLYHTMYVDQEKPANTVKELVLEEPPTLGLTITYKDIGKKSHKQRYEVKPVLYSFKKDTNGGPAIFPRDESQELTMLSNGSLRVEKLH